jgi:hypothetical protein
VLGSSFGLSIALGTPALGACLFLRSISPGSWSPLDILALANSDAALALIRLGARPLLVFSTLCDQPIWRLLLAPYHSMVLSGHQSLWRSAALHSLPISCSVLALSCDQPF